MHLFQSVQFVPGNIDEVWYFFSSPENLSKITPPKMGFKIINPKRIEKMYAGMIITYKVKPMLGIAVNWMTEITKMKKNEFFIDNQLHGPYKVWHHEHHFKEVEGGVEMTDIVHYVVPFGILGRLLNGIFIKREVEKIFEYRQLQIDRFFGKK